MTPRWRPTAGVFLIIAIIVVWAVLIASLAEIADLYASRRTEISLWSKAKAWPQPYIPGTYVKCSLIIVCKLSYLPTSRPLLISRISASILRPIHPSISLILV